MMLLTRLSTGSGIEYRRDRPARVSVLWFRKWSTSSGGMGFDFSLICEEDVVGVYGGGAAVLVFNREGST